MTTNRIIPFMSIITLAASCLWAQPKSAVQFYDTTGTTLTASFGWKGTATNGKFFIADPNGTESMTLQNGTMAVNGTIQATTLQGDGSSLTNLTPKDGSVTTAKITDSAITAAKIKNGAVTNAKIDSVDWLKISNKPVIPGGTVGDNTITTVKIVDSAITAAKIKNGAVTNVKIDSVSWAKVFNRPPNYIPSSHTHSSAEIVSGKLDTARILNAKYLIDTAGADGKVWKWDGTIAKGKWADDLVGTSNSGTITGVTAGSGITGGGTSGIVTVNANFTTTGGTNGSAVTVARGDHAHGQYADTNYVKGKIPTTLPPSGTATGDLTGTYPAPTIANEAVTDSKIASGISATKITTGTLTTSVIPNSQYMISSAGSAGQVWKWGTSSASWTGLGISDIGGLQNSLDTKADLNSPTISTPVITQSLEVSGSSPVLLINGGTSTMPQLRFMGNGANNIFDNSGLTASTFNFSNRNSAGITTSIIIAPYMDMANSLTLSRNTSNGTISTSTGSIILNPASGSAYIGSNVITTGASDSSFKKNIKPIDSAISKIGKIAGVTYEWNTEQFPKRHFDKNRHIGFIAQNVQKQFPEVVQKDLEGYLEVDYAKMTAVLVEATKEQQKIIESQQKQIDDLKTRLDRIEASEK